MGQWEALTGGKYQLNLNIAAWRKVTGWKDADNEGNNRLSTAGNQGCFWTELTRNWNGGGSEWQRWTCWQLTMPAARFKRKQKPSAHPGAVLQIMGGELECPSVIDAEQHNTFNNEALALVTRSAQNSPA